MELQGRTAYLPVFHPDPAYGLEVFRASFDLFLYLAGFEFES